MSERVQFLRAGSPLWADYLQCAHHDFHSSAAYHDFMQEQGQGQAWLAVVGSRDKFLAWPFLLRGVDAASAPRPEEPCDITSVYGYAGPLTNGCTPGDPFLLAAWQAMVEQWRARGVVSLFCRFHPLLENHRWAPPAPVSLQLALEGHTVSLDLSQTDGEAWAEYRESHRRHIARARRAGLGCEVDASFAYLPDFARLYRDTMRRNAAAAEYFFSAEYFDRLQRKLSPAISLHVARAGGRVAAAALVSEYQGIVQYLFSGVDDEFLHLSPLKLLVDAIRRWARSRGADVLHLGGGRGGREDSLYHFKSGFSPNRHPFYTGRCILDPDVYRFLSEKRSREAAKSGRTIDPNYFPAYRAPFAGVAAAGDRVIDSVRTLVGQQSASRVGQAFSLPLRRMNLLLLALAVLLPSAWCAQLTYNVKLYGALGDGFTNDTGAIQTAINAASRAGGGTVYFPSAAGCYLVTGLTFYSNMTYTGESPSVCIKLISSSAPLIATPATSAFSNATISNLTLNGNANSFTGHDCLDLKGPTNVVIDHVTTTRCGEDGVYVTGWGTEVNPAGQGDGLLVTNLTSTDNGRNGMSIITGRNITVRDSRFERHTISVPFAGVDVEPNSAAQSVENVTFENCAFRDNTYNGFTAWEAHADRPHLNLRLINCTFEGNGRDGAYIAASRHLIRGVYVSGAMAANRSRDGYKGGLDIWYAGDVVVTNLSVADASQALLLWGVEGATVANSSLSGSVRDLNTTRSKGVRVHTSVNLAHQAHTGSFTMNSGVAPRITTMDLGPATAGAAFSGSLAATGDPAITWTQVAGSLPAGLALSNTGSITGMPATGGVYNFTARAGNAVTYDERSYTLTVAGPTPSKYLHRPPVLRPKGIARNLKELTNGPTR